MIRLVGIFYSQKYLGKGEIESSEMAPKSAQEIHTMLRKNYLSETGLSLLKPGSDLSRVESATVHFHAHAHCAT